MTREEYLDQMVDDIKDYIKENHINLFDEDGNIDENARERLYDDLWIEDSVTGNGSGSYTFNSYKAHENIMGAEDVIREMVDEFCIEVKTVAEKFLNEDWEYWDVSIRCYLLGEALDTAIDSLADELGKESD